MHRSSSKSPNFTFNSKMSEVKRVHCAFKEQLHPNPKLACFVLLSQNCNIYWKKMMYRCKIFKKIKNGLESLVDQTVLSFGSKWSKYCLDLYLKNCLAYLNYSAIL